jgi:hypothetical protein
VIQGCVPVEESGRLAHILTGGTTRKVSKEATEAAEDHAIAEAIVSLG